MPLKYAGVPVRIGGTDYIVPSLSMAGFIEHYDLLVQENNATSKDEIKKRFEDLVPVIGEALRRNYPDVKDDLLRGELDMFSFPAAIKAIQAASGLVPTTGE